MPGILGLEDPPRIMHVRIAAPSGVQTGHIVHTHNGSIKA